MLEEVKVLQEGIRLSADRLALLAKTIHEDVRKSSIDDNTAKLIISTKAWFRLATMFLHGVKRIGHVDVSLGEVKEEKVERPPAKPIQPQATTVLDDIETLYGTGVIYGDP